MRKGSSEITKLVSGRVWALSHWICSNSRAPSAILHWFPTRKQILCVASTKIRQQPIRISAQFPRLYSLAPDFDSRHTSGPSVSLVQRPCNVPALDLNWDLLVHVLFLLLLFFILFTLCLFPSDIVLVDIDFSLIFQLYWDIIDI